MASDAEILSRLLAIETKISNAITLPNLAIDINDTKVANKTGYCCFGIKAGINEGNLFVAISEVANPITDTDFKQPFVFKAF